MKIITTLIILLFSIFICSAAQGQTSRLELMEAIGDLEFDLMIIIKNTSSEEQLKKSIQLLKREAEEADIQYYLTDGRIESLSFRGNGHGCASEQFGVLVVGIKDGEVTGCFVRDGGE